MAKPKVSERKNWMEEMRRESEEREKRIKSFPLLAERWYVDEKQPDHHQHNEYTGDTDTTEGRVSTVSPYYDTREEAEKFIKAHEPDKKGGKFILRHQYLRTHTKVWNEWGNL